MRFVCAVAGAALFACNLAGLAETKVACDQTLTSPLRSNVTISSAHEWNYRSVNASVTIGQVSARVYGADKGGFFRSFTKKNTDGEYRLRAHVMTGEIDLVGRKARAEGASGPD